MCGEANSWAFAKEFCGVMLKAALKGGFGVIGITIAIVTFVRSSKFVQLGITRIPIGRSDKK